MTPSEVSKNLIRMANYIDGNSTPDRAKIFNGLNTILSNIRTSGDVKKFTKKEFDGAIQGIDSLISRMNKVVKTMNKQDPASVDLLEAVNTFTQSRKMIVKEYQGLNAQV